MIRSKSRLWEKFARSIRQRDTNHQGYVICASCDHVIPYEETDCGHFIENTERKKDWGGNELWYEPLNFAAQCIKCNRFNAAEAKRNWTAKFLKKHGYEKYHELLERHRTPRKWTPEEVHEIINKIR